MKKIIVALSTLVTMLSLLALAPQDPAKSSPKTQELERSIRTITKDATLVPMSGDELKIDKTFKFPGATAPAGGQTDKADVVAFEIGKVDGKSAYLDVALPRDEQAKAASDFADALKGLGTLDVGGTKVQSCASKPKCVKVCTVDGVEHCCKYSCET